MRAKSCRPRRWMPTSTCGRTPGLRLTAGAFSGAQSFGVEGNAAVEWRAMRQWLFTILASISLAACLTTCGLWVRSYTATETWRRGTPQTWEAWTIGHGRLLYIRARPAAASKLNRVEDWHRQTEAPNGDVSRDQWLVTVFHEVGGFAWGTGIGGVYQGWAAVIPLWCLAGLTSVLPATWVRGALNRRKQRQHIRLVRCIGCGYDLRATPSRCPECGTVPKAVS